MNALQAAGLWLCCNRTRSFLFFCISNKASARGVFAAPPRRVQTNRGSSSVFYETFQSHLYESGPDMSAGRGSVRGWVGSLLRREHETSSRIPARLLLLNKTPRNLLSPFNSTLTPPWGAWSIIPLDWSPKSHLRGGMHSLRAFKVLLIWCWCWWWWWCR